MLSTPLSFEAKMQDKARKAVLMRFKAVLKEVFICQALGLKSSLSILRNLCRYIRARAATQQLDTEKNLSPLSIPLNGNNTMLQKLQHLSLQESQGSLQPDSLFWCCECFGRKQTENSNENFSRQKCLCQIVGAGIKRHQSFKQALNTVLEGFRIHKWVRQGQIGLNFWKISFYFRQVESRVRDRVSKRNSLQNEE